jgi:hypothetical protein
VRTRGKGTGDRERRTANWGRRTRDWGQEGLRSVLTWQSELYPVSSRGAAQRRRGDPAAFDGTASSAFCLLPMNSRPCRHPEEAGGRRRTPAHPERGLPPSQRDGILRLRCVPAQDDASFSRHRAHGPSHRRLPGVEMLAVTVALTVRCVARRMKLLGKARNPVVRPRHDRKDRSGKVCPVLDLPDTGWGVTE